MTRKLLKIRLIYSKRILRLLKALYKVGLVKSFVVFKESTKLFIHLTLFFYKNRPFFKGLRLVSTPSKKFYISYKGLCLLSRSIGNSIYLVSTSKGILTHLDCISGRLGGLLLCAIV